MTDSSSTNLFNEQTYCPILMFFSCYDEICLSDRIIKLLKMNNEGGLTTSQAFFVGDVNIFGMRLFIQFVISS